jgi:murein DD-endopeptidase MepM/ murein hydrolase activator NlpD
MWMKQYVSKFRRAKYLNFLIYPDQGKGISLRISKTVGCALVGILGVLTAIFVIFVISLGEISYRAFLAESLLQENQRLRDHNARVTELEKELNDYRDLTTKIAQLAGIEKASLSRAIDWNEGLVLANVSPGQTGNGEALLFSENRKESWQGGDGIPYGMPLDGWLSKGFKEDPKTLGGAHPGIDIAASAGKEVMATASGEVKFADWDDYYGKLIIIDHKKGYQTYYGHNSELRVSKNEKVKRGQVIALSGNSGRSSAPHLHYEIKKNGVSVDPEKYIGTKDEKR